jgi:DNA gyrase subunit B
MRWSKDFYSEQIIGFANGIRTIDGGSHIDGLKSAVSKTVNAVSRKLNKIKEAASNIPGEYLREGLTAVVSVKVPEPEFEGQTKTRLGNPEMRHLVDSVLSEGLNNVFEWHPQLLNAIVNKALDAQAAALAAKAARDMVQSLNF